MDALKHEKKNDKVLHCNNIVKRMSESVVFKKVNFFIKCLEEQSCLVWF